MRRRAFFQRCLAATAALLVPPPLAHAFATRRRTVETQDVEAIIRAALGTLPQQAGRGALTNYGNEADWQASGGGWIGPSLRASIDWACDIVGAGAVIWGITGIWMVAAEAFCASFVITNVTHSLWTGFQTYNQSTGNRIVNWMWTNVYPTP